ncbi:uncharacterized protein LOC132060533 isoform X2 [Lycium ferocissimum]|uniref:uncharacterized protein LOC132060533 isoform X2 n=1 Tax=Lycium ferocissimum TaxID=112874 RepID=UPI002814C6BB|nr:uncharacterized protein LOC132060533 isoform X2 [Lycium ferocissimum]
MNIEEDENDLVFYAIQKGMSMDNCSTWNMPKKHIDITKFKFLQLGKGKKNTKNRKRKIEMFHQMRINVMKNLLHTYMKNFPQKSAHFHEVEIHDITSIYTHNKQCAANPTSSFFR